ncbi:phosphotransferase [Streptomyces fragilis]|uniref:Phosphotransferase n=1 Tax=Streptomyces fragilis TaxID=67301 RepID=A0ABV2YAW4_9ACTN|nr:phosphotransferase [Streptomyces fragilis]
MVLIGVGRTADVYVLDERWVLRRYRDAAAGDAEAESDLMTHLHACGYPVPLVRPRDEGTARTDLVLERLDGPTMAGALVAGLITPQEAGTLLALLLTRLHRVPPRTAEDPATRILHLDLHPENVILTSAGPRVIDWADAVEGRPGLDWAMTSLILAQYAAAAGRGTGALAHEVLAALLSDPEAGHLTPSSLAQALRRRAANPTMTQREIAVLDQAGAAVREVTGLRAA